MKPGPGYSAVQLQHGQLMVAVVGAVFPAVARSRLGRIGDRDRERRRGDDE
jgi:hypothetical protein